MTALMIIFAVVVIILILLLAPIHLNAVFDNELTLKLRYLFLIFTIVPAKEKKAKKKNKSTKENKSEKKPEKEKKNSKIKDIISKKGISGLIDIVKEIASIATGTLADLFKHIVISKLYIDISVSDDDAAQTAINYGYICSGLYPSLGIILAQISHCKKQVINVYPDFDGNETKIDCEIRLHIKALFAISAFLKAFFRAVKLYKNIEE